MIYTAKAKLQQGEAVKQYIPLVEKIANQIYKKTQFIHDLDDLIQAGMLGLLDGLSKYQIQADTKIETYLSVRVQGSIIDEIRKDDYLSQDDRNLLKKIDKASIKPDGSPRSYLEIAELLDMRINDVMEAKKLSINHLSLNDEQHEYLAETLASNEQIENFLFKKEQRTALVKEIENLPEKEKLLMGLYYQEDCTLKEIGAILELTEARVSQLHSTIVKKLKENLKEYA